MTIAESLLQALQHRLDRPRPPAAQVEPPPSPRPKNILNSLDLRQSLPRKEYERSLRKHQGQLGRMSRSMAEAKCSAVVVLEGPDAAGKGGCIRRVVKSLDARFYRVIPIAAPTDEEAARPYLWRFWRSLPRQGRFCIYDRSWYGRVLVERIEGFCGPRDWQRAYAEINAFEEELARFGTLVVKFWLAISPREQLERFEQREATGYKRYKLTPEDWRNREKWPAYEAAVCDMIERTSTEFAPWTLVEANDKRFARVKVLETVCERLRRALAHHSSQGKRRSRRKR